MHNKSSKNSCVNDGSPSSMHFTNAYYANILGCVIYSAPMQYKYIVWGIPKVHSQIQNFVITLSETIWPSPSTSNSEMSQVFLSFTQSQVFHKSFFPSLSLKCPKSFFALHRKPGRSFDEGTAVALTSNDSYYYLGFIGLLC